jgi:hypothetical protein
MSSFSPHWLTPIWAASIRERRTVTSPGSLVRTPWLARMSASTIAIELCDAVEIPLAPAFMCTFARRTTLAPSIRMPEVAPYGDTPLSVTVTSSTLVVPRRTIPCVMAPAGVMSGTTTFTLASFEGASARTVITSRSFAAFGVADLRTVASPSPTISTVFPTVLDQYSNSVLVS